MIHMNKHPIDLLIEKENELLPDIKDYLEELVQGKYEHFEAHKLPEDRYMILVKLNALRFMASIHVTIEEVFELGTKMKWETTEDVVLNYLQSRIEEEILFWLNNDFIEEE